MTDPIAPLTASPDLIRGLEASLTAIRVGAERIAELLTEADGNAPLTADEHRQIAADALKAAKAGLWDEAIDLLDVAAGDAR